MSPRVERALDYDRMRANLAAGPAPAALARAAVVRPGLPSELTLERLFLLAR